MDLRHHADTDRPTNYVAARTEAAPDARALIPLPRAGELVIVRLSEIATAQFAFDPNSAQSVVRGDDLVLSINGGEVVLVGYLEALRLDALPAFTSPAGETVFPDALLSRPGGQPPQSAGKAPEIPESSGGFTPFDDAQSLGLPHQLAGGLAGTALEYRAPVHVESFLPVPLVPAAAPVIPPPDAVDDAAATDEDTPVTVDVLANDKSSDGSDLTVETASAGNGAVVINPDNTLSYTPDPDFSGTDTITYTVKDGSGGTATATVTVTVNPVNDAPVAVDDAVATDEDVAVSGSVLGNDSDPDGDLLTAALIDGPANGALQLNADGTYTYTPNANFNGLDKFTYVANDGAADSKVATVLIAVLPVNDPPVAADDADATDEDVAVGGSVLGNDSDPEGDKLTALLIDDADHGTLQLNEDGTFTYAPDKDFNGSDEFTYQVDDGKGGTATAIVSIT
ncbi:MAG TPA: cadherin-like domain-containing protein, partial [Dongiaceae bacterium]